MRGASPASCECSPGLSRASVLPSALPPGATRALVPRPLDTCISHTPGTRHRALGVCRVPLLPSQGPTELLQLASHPQAGPTFHLSTASDWVPRLTYLWAGPSGHPPLSVLRKEPGRRLTAARPARSSPAALIKHHSCRLCVHRFPQRRPETADQTHQDKVSPGTHSPPPGEISQTCHQEGLIKTDGVGKRTHGAGPGPKSFSLHFETSVLLAEFRPKPTFPDRPGPELPVSPGSQGDVCVHTGLWG